MNTRHRSPKRGKHIAGVVAILGTAFCSATTGTGEPTGAGKPKRIAIVSSYHREYLWSQDTQAGVNKGLLEFGFMESESHTAELVARDLVEGLSATVKKLWMDTKNKSSRQEIIASTSAIAASLQQFSPNVILLGDDNAANHIGNVFKGSGVPVVFWGINGNPLKYDLLDSLDRPGHNITGVYQQGYLKECLEFLSRVVPTARTLAVLSDDSETGRAKAKELEKLHGAGVLPLRLEATVVTNSLPEWKSRALELQSKVDAFFILNHNSIKDETGAPVDQLAIGAWYLRNIKIPECAHEKQFAQEGMLCVCDDSGFNQGYVGIIARQLGLDEEAAELMEHASPLHDIGKIGIPDAILLKPGRLTPEEFEFMQSHCQLGRRVFDRISTEEWDLFRKHTEFGAQILENRSSSLMAMAARIAQTHHEKWDGSGYPLAMAGEDIPLEGRITAVADVFDALSSKRPYKPALPLEKCLAIMEEGRAKHFDPRVLDAFLARIKDIVAVQIECADTA